MKSLPVHPGWVLVALAGVGVAGMSRLRTFEVVGQSMEPTLTGGDRLLAVRLGRPRLGEVVVVTDRGAADLEVVKRVIGVTGHGMEVRGDNPAASRDSRHFGPVPHGAVRARVVYRYWPPTRRGRIRSR